MPGKCRCVPRWNGDHCETYDESFPGGVTYPSTEDQCELNRCPLKAADGQCDVSRGLVNLSTATSFVPVTQLNNILFHQSHINHFEIL